MLGGSRFRELAYIYIYIWTIVWNRDKTIDIGEVQSIDVGGERGFTVYTYT